MVRTFLGTRDLVNYNHLRPGFLSENVSPSAKAINHDLVNARYSNSLTFQRSLLLTPTRSLQDFTTYIDYTLVITALQPGYDPVTTRI